LEEEMTALRTFSLAASLIVAGGTGVVFAQGANMGAWDIRRPDKPGCPGFTIQIARTGNQLAGSAWSGGTEVGEEPKLSKVRGTIDGGGNYNLTITPVDPGAPQGKITGQANVDAGYIQSTMTGSGCHDGTMRIRVAPPPLEGGSG
jgi:hypothetical protein